jgi:hypothetical protein
MYRRNTFFKTHNFKDKITILKTKLLFTKNVTPFLNQDFKYHIFKLFPAFKLLKTANQNKP